MLSTEQRDELVAGLAPLPAYVLSRADWLCAELLADAGRERVLKWAWGGMPSARVEDVGIYGDEALQPHIVRALAVLPPPVLNDVARGCSLFGFGARVFGVCMSPPSDRTMLVVVGREGEPHRVAYRTLHEVAHSHCHDVPVGGVGLPVAGERRLREMAAEEGWLPTVEAADARYARGEDEADALAAVWLKRLYGADYTRLFERRT